MRVTVPTILGRLVAPILLAVVVGSIFAAPRAALAMQPPTEAQAAGAAGRGEEVNLVLPDLSQVEFRGINGRTLLMAGLGVCALGLLFGLVVFTQLKNLPVDASRLQL